MAEVASAGLSARRHAPWESSRHRFVTADGTALYVREDGPAGAPVTVLFLHGWTCDHTIWDRNAAAVLDAEAGTVRVVRYDHRGHGGSAPARDGTATIDQLADDAAELIGARVPHGRLVLVGHSMGGMTMMALAERYPELVRSRVAGAMFVSTTPRSLARVTLGFRGPLGDAVVRGENALTTVLARTRRERFLGRPAPLRPFVRRLVFGKGASRHDVAALTAQLGRTHPASMSGFRRSFSTHERRVALSRFAGIPSTVVVGTRDQLTPVPHSRTIAEELPDAEFVLYPNAGHMLPYERTEELDSRILAHVRAAARRHAAG